MEPTIFKPRLKFKPPLKFFKFGHGFYKFKSGPWIKVVYVKFKKQRIEKNSNGRLIIYIYTFAWVSGCLFVCLCPINVRTAKPIGPKFCVGPHMTPGKIYGKSKFRKSTKFLFKIRKTFLFVLQFIQIENIHN